MAANATPSPSMPEIMDKTNKPMVIIIPDILLAMAYPWRAQYGLRLPKIHAAPQDFSANFSESQ
jgi:hypothetical protein